MTWEYLITSRETGEILQSGRNFKTQDDAKLQAQMEAKADGIKNYDISVFEEVGLVGEIMKEPRKFWITNRRAQQNCFFSLLAEANCDDYGYARKESLPPGTRFNEKSKGLYNDVFAINPYYWGDDEEVASLPNFEYKPTGFKLYWYKYPLRGAWSNTDISCSEFEEICRACIASLHTTIPTSSKSIEAIAYERYQYDWLSANGFSLKDVVTSVLAYQTDTENGDDEAKKVFDDWELEAGMGGSLYVCFNEFLGAEYNDREYMRKLLTDEEFERYLQKNKEKSFSLYKA